MKELKDIAVSGSVLGGTRPELELAKLIGMHSALEEILNEEFITEEDY
jgi:hypothetical protein